MKDAVRSPLRHTEPDADQAEAAYRGFLFADLRGYTAFVERHGDAAAADLLDAYRALVREEVERHAGAEIRTEGDSFYLVFPSARRAVSCGMAIVAAAERVRLDQPERPIRVGIGINAGETVQRGEGFVGTAVNLAARVCAQAREGEVLITAAVRDAVGAGAGIRIVARGSRRLKGIARPVPLFAVEPDTVSSRRALGPGPSTVRWLPVAVAATAALLTVVVIAVMAGLPGGQPQSGTLLTPSPSSSSSLRGTPTASDVPAADSNADAYPNPLEAELLTSLDSSISSHCVRADDEDRPIIHVDQETATRFNVERRIPMPFVAGVQCEVPSIHAPDVVHFWRAQRFGDTVAAGMPEFMIHNRAGANSIPLGDCSTTNVAYQEWELGDLGGWLLCRELYGDAIIEWSYDYTPLLGVAVRRDGDLAALIRWWRAEARFISP